MQHTLWKAMATMVMIATLSACAPLVVGGAAAIVADEAVEQNEGGDGLF